MEENILKILLSHIEAVTEKNSPFVPTAINGVPQSAKEIASHFREFIEELFLFNNEWFDCQWPEGDKPVFLIKDKPNHGIVVTLDELYNYWMKEVKK